MPPPSLAILINTLLCFNASAFCFQEAGRTYGIAPALLKAIAQAESNLDPSAIHHNSNGTVDAGLMQINSIWADKLGPTWNYLFAPCTNVMVGAWILHQCIDDYCYTYAWQAIGCYHSRTPSRRNAYATRIDIILQEGGTP